MGRKGWGNWVTDTGVGDGLSLTSHRPAPRAENMLIKNEGKENLKACRLSAGSIPVQPHFRVKPEMLKLLLKALQQPTRRRPTSRARRSREADGVDSDGGPG